MNFGSGSKLETKVRKDHAIEYVKEQGRRK